MYIIIEFLKWKCSEYAIIIDNCVSKYVLLHFPYLFLRLYVGTVVLFKHY